MSLLFSESKRRKFVITSALIFLGYRAIQKRGAVIVKLVDFLILVKEPALDFVIGARFGKCVFRLVGLAAQVKEFFHCGLVFIIVSLNILFHIRIGQSLEAGLLFGRCASNNHLEVGEVVARAAEFHVCLRTIAACGLGKGLGNLQSLLRLKNANFSHGNFLSGISPIKVV